MKNTTSLCVFSTEYIDIYAQTKQNGAEIILRVRKVFVEGKKDTCSPVFTVDESFLTCCELHHAVHCRSAFTLMWNTACRQWFLVSVHSMQLAHSVIIHKKSDSKSKCSSATLETNGALTQSVAICLLCVHDSHEQSGVTAKVTVLTSISKKHQTNHFVT